MSALFSKFQAQEFAIEKSTTQPLCKFCGTFSHQMAVKTTIASMQAASRALETEDRDGKRLQDRAAAKYVKVTVVLEPAYKM